MVRSTRTGAVCMLGAAALLAACQRAQPVDAANKLPEPPRVEAQNTVQKQAGALVSEMKKTLKTPAASSKPAPPKPAAAEPAAVTPAPASARVAESRPAAPQLQAGPDAEAAERRGDDKRDEDEPIVTTISGCLERHRGDRFRLTDMVGEHAPKSRSWKTGFFRKGSAKLDLIDETSRLKLASHVGYRVDVTGALFKKAMRARAMNPTPARCS